MKTIELNEIKSELAMCTSVKVNIDEEGDVEMAVTRYRGQSTPSSKQVDYIQSFENYVGTISNSKLYKIHKRVMSSLINVIKKHPNLDFYISVC